MIDVHEQLGILSKSYQSNSLVLFDIPMNLNKTLFALKKQESTPAKSEQAFLDQVAKDDNAYALQTVQLTDVEDGIEERVEDRTQTLSSLTEFLTSRFKKVLNDPILQAMGAFDHRKWHSTKAAISGQFSEQIELLYTTYKSFYEDDETLEMVQDQWEQIKLLIIENEGMMARKFHSLWAQMLIHYHEHFNLVLRLVAISLILPTDTSECERVFSLMNDLKTELRSRLGQVNLRNLMVWHTAAKDLPFANVPVMEILEAFRNLSGIRGRHAHRGTAPPQYDFRIKEELE
jgi:hypothetical protein